VPKILIIRFSSIGDIVLTTPVIRAVFEQIPQAEVHFLTKSNYAFLFEAHPFVTKVWSWNKRDSSQILEDLKSQHFDYIIDLHHNLRSLKVKVALDAPAFSFNKLNIEKWLMVHAKKNILPNVHIVERYGNTLFKLGITQIPKQLDFFIPQKEEIELVKILPELKRPFVVACIGAQHETKKMPIDKWKSLLEKVNSSVLVLGGAEDYKNGEQLSELKNVHNLCGKLSVFGSASLIKQSTMVITHDTGMMHIAAAFQKKIISIWGNTIPEFGMYPYGVEHSFIFEVKKLSCRPCSKIGFQACPKSHFRCMNDQEIDKMIDLVNSQIIE
jgi:ADP-heptose:LPS heptosyltransferase